MLPNAKSWVITGALDAEKFVLHVLGRQQILQMLSERWYKNTHCTVAVNGGKKEDMSDTDTSCEMKGRS